MKIKFAGQFKRDFKRAKKQKKNLDALEDIITKLVRGKKLGPRYHDHKLHGEWAEHKCCHIQPDWLLIYKIESNTLYLGRVGSHAELFK
ncbi:type II toxin-antitoxin system YafQ family toxin [Planctomycetota bacterium]